MAASGPRIFGVVFEVTGLKPASLGYGSLLGDITVKPWGERSFYVEDPWGNGICFVDETTRFTGR